MGEEQGRIDFTEQEQYTPDGTKGEILMMEKRKQMDIQNGRINGKVSVTKSKKRDCTGGGEYLSRPTKKRKYVLVGDNWGEIPGNANQGLECLVTPDPCERDGTGALLTGNTETRVGYRTARDAPEDLPKVEDIEPCMRDGTGPLLRGNTETRVGYTTATHQKNYLH